MPQRSACNDFGLDALRRAASRQRVAAIEIGERMAGYGDDPTFQGRPNASAALAVAA